MEHVIGSGDSSEKENIAVHDAPIAEDPHRPRRDPRPPKRLIEEANIVAYALSVADEIEGNAEPSSYSEVIISGDCNKWMTAMHDEMESLEKNGTWEFLKLRVMRIMAAALLVGASTVVSQYYHYALAFD